jgi:DNA-directed RNA polymerase subunit L
MLLDAKRLFIEDSFDFTIETIGIYSNYKLLELGISLIIKKLYVTLESLKNENDLIYDATDTLDNCYIITLLNEDYTIGKIIEYYLFNKYFKEDKLVNYVGFLKKHPHDNDSFIKISFKNLVSKDELLIMIEDSVNNSILLLNSVKEYFTDK